MERHFILRRLGRRNIIGGKHLPERIIKSWLRGNPQHAKQALEDYATAVRSGIIRRFPHTGEIHVSIDPRRLDQAKRLTGGTE